MPEKVRIALDAMGGDYGPPSCWPEPRSRSNATPRSNTSWSAIARLSSHCLARRHGLRAASRLVHTDRRGEDERKAEPGAPPWPVEIIHVDGHRCGEERRCRRGGFGREYRRADGDGEISPQDDGRASSGRQSPRCGRPCAASRSCSIVGATIGADAKHLVDFAVMGGAMARVLFDLDRPTIGLLNIGVEEVKGLEEVREAGASCVRRRDATSNMSASSRATISARERWMSWSPRVLPAISP